MSWNNEIFFFRTLFVIVAKKRLYAHQINVIIVFLYDFIDIEIYVTQFDEFVVNLKLICHLIKTLYDLKQTLKMWYEVIRNFLKFLKFESINENVNVFVFKNKKIYIAIYVNDFFIIEFNMNFINNLKKQLDQRFKMIDLKSTQYYLNIEVIRKNDNIFLRQIIYLTKVLKRFNMINCKIVASSMKSKLINNILFFSFDYKTDVDIFYWYESIVNSLMYAVTMTKFDIIYVFSIINRYCNNSNRTHVKTIKRIFQYIKKTFHYDLKYEFNQQFYYDYNDVDWENVKNERRFIDDYIFFIDENFVFWMLKRQNDVVLFNCEFEYMTFNETNKKVSWMKRFFMKFDHFNDQFNFLWTDNQKTIALNENFEFHRRTKHIDVRYHWIKKKSNENLSTSSICQRR